MRERERDRDREREKERERLPSEEQYTLWVDTVITSATAEEYSSSEGRPNSLRTCCKQLGQHRASQDSMSNGLSINTTKQSIILGVMTSINSNKTNS
jgi:hypothetical protein